MQACDRCHVRKTRCDRRLPNCSACEKAGAQCLHKDKLRQRHIPRGYLNDVESRLQRATEENAKLKSEMAMLCARYGSRSATDSARVPSTVRAQVPSPDHGQTSFPSEAVSTEVGSLALTATGETRYVGSSSGIGLARIMTHMVDGTTGLPLVSTELRKGHSAEPDNTAADLLESGNLPSKRSAQPFIEAYFQHTHVTFPLLHRTSFLEVCELIYSSTEYYTSNPYDAFVFDMVLSIGSSNFNRFGDASAVSALHYARAQAKLPAVLGMPGLRPLRAMLLLSQHGIFSNLKDTSASIWHLVGISVRMCYEMGLHTEPRLRSRTVLHNPHDTSISFEEEMNRRCFWCLYNLDRVVSFTLGRPAAIKDEDIDVCLPSVCDDNDFGPGKPVPPAQSGDNQASPFLHLVRIRRISGQILSAFYRVRQLHEFTREELCHIRHQLLQEVKSWNEDTAHVRMTNHPPSDGSFTSCFLTKEWYTAVFNNAVLLLYRPSPSFPHSASSPSQINEEGNLLQLWSAAKGSITAYADLHNKRRLNYSWITLHGVFIAGLTYIYCIGRALKDPYRTTPLPDYLEIINDTRTCSNVLVAICERWNIVRRSCEMFNQLSNAVIRDAVNDANRNHSLSSQVKDFSTTTEAPIESQNSFDVPQGNNGTTSTAMTLDQDESSANMVGDAGLNDQLYIPDNFEHFLETFDGVSTHGFQAYQGDITNGFPQDWPLDASFANQQGSGLQTQHEIW